MKVGEIMTRDVITVNEGDTVLEAAKTLRKNRISGAPVLNENGELVGIVSEADLLRVLEGFSWHSKLLKFLHILDESEEIQQDFERINNMKVAEIMSKNPKTVRESDSVYDAAAIMHSHGFNRLPVVDENGKLVGIIARADILASMQV